MSGNNYRGHKFTVCCPIKGCKYTSRQWVGMVDNVSKENSVWSTKCPKHQEILIKKQDNGRPNARNTRRPY